MRTNLGLAISVLFASMAFGQTPSDPGAARLYRFTQTDSPDSFQEMANVIRAITEMQHVAVNNTVKSLIVHGSAEQVAMADILFHALDQPVGAQPALMPEYHMTQDIRAPVMRVFYLTQTATPQGFQEIVNVVRSVMDVQRVAVYNAAKAIVLRGTQEQTSGSEWVIKGLDRPPVNQAQGSSKMEFALSDTHAPVARLFYLVNTPTQQGIQEIVNAIRTITEMPRVMPCNLPRVLSVRGTAEQIALAEWMINKLDVPAGVALAGQSLKPQIVFEYPGGRKL